MAAPTSLDRLSGAGPAPLRTATDLAAVEATPSDDRIAAQSTYQALQIGASTAPGAAALQFLSKADPDEVQVTVSYAQFMAGVTQAAGTANPVNPVLSAAPIREILRAVNTRVLVVLGPVPGTNIWDKVQRVKGELPNLKAIVVVHGAADEANGALRCTPKLAPHSHRNQVYQAWAMGVMLPLGSGRTLLFGLPLFHVGGALTQGLSPLAWGCTLVVMSPAGWPGLGRPCPAPGCAS